MDTNYYTVHSRCCTLLFNSIQPNERTAEPQYSHNCVYVHIRFSMHDARQCVRSCVVRSLNSLVPSNVSRLQPNPQTVPKPTRQPFLRHPVRVANEKNMPANLAGRCARSVQSSTNFRATRAASRVNYASKPERHMLSARFGCCVWKSCGMAFAQTEAIELDK